MKKIINQILFPSKFIAIPFCLFSVVLLVNVFSIHLEGTLISYISYLLSTYSLILFVIWFIKTCKFTTDEIKKRKLYKTYNKNINLINKYAIIISSLVNLLFGIFELITGIYYKSWWFITLAIYYLILCFMKILLLKNIKHLGENIKKELKKLKNTGIILLLLNIVLTEIIILTIKYDHYINYQGYLIYAIALYDFYLIISAVINVIKYRYYNSPIIIANKCISLTVAMISMLSLEIAMISKFGNNETNFKFIMISLTGLAIVIINSIMSIIMIIKSNEKRKNKSKNL